MPRVSLREISERGGIPLWMVYVYMYAFQGDPLNQLYVLQRGDDDDVVLYDSDHVYGSVTIPLKKYLSNMR